MAGQPVSPRADSLPGWTRQSFLLLGGCLLVMGVVACRWWPFARTGLVIDDGWGGGHFDWLLAGNFLAMFALIMTGTEWRKDLKISLAGLAGGLLIECWGTQANLWTYYTAERPPLWIIPAWAISSVAIDRLARLLAWAENKLSGKASAWRESWLRRAYWVVFGGFYVVLISFVAPTMDKSLTWAALILCAAVIARPSDYRWPVLTFFAGSGLGYFLERWGTTRECWTYYTHQTPPLFAVLAHGMACVAFWRLRMFCEQGFRRFTRATKVATYV